MYQSPNDVFKCIIWADETREGGLSSSCHVASLPHHWMVVVVVVVGVTVLVGCH